MWEAVRSYAANSPESLRTKVNMKKRVRCLVGSGLGSINDQQQKAWIRTSQPKC